MSRKRKNSRREYFQKYYIDKVKPFRKQKSPSIMIRCPSCNLPIPPSFFLKSFVAYSACLRFGNRYEELSVASHNQKTYDIAMGIMRKYYSHLSIKSLKFIRWCLNQNLLSKEYFIAQFVDIIPSVENHNIAAARLHIKPLYKTVTRQYKSSIPTIARIKQSPTPISETAKAMETPRPKPVIAKVVGGRD
ncbi:MAG: hypothetical protein ABIA21_02210 [Candidatus Aenigmatarchaeota archaeon]